MLWRILGTLAGLALLVIGVPLMVSPIPLGLPLIFVAVVILVASNPLAASLLKAARKRYPWLNRFLRKAEDVLPEELAGPLDATEDKSDLNPAPAQTAAKLGPPMQRIDIPRRRR